MKTSKIESIYNEIAHLSVTDRDRLYNRIKKTSIKIKKS